MKPTQTCAPPQQLWIDREDALSTIEKLESTQNCTAAEANLLRDFHRDGYIVWRKVISEEAVAALRDELPGKVPRFRSLIHSIGFRVCVLRKGRQK